jgi:hypothetical protein
VGGGSRQQALAETLQNAGLHVVSVQSSDATRRIARCPDLNVVVDADALADRMLPWRFTAANAEVCCESCEAEIWRSVRLLQVAYRRLVKPGGRLVLLESAIDGSVGLRVWHIMASGARRALVASAATRWRPEGVTVALLTLTDEPTGPESVAETRINPGAAGLLRFLAVGDCIALSGHHLVV